MSSLGVGKGDNFLGGKGRQHQMARGSAARSTAGGAAGVRTVTRPSLSETLAGGAKVNDLCDLLTITYRHKYFQDLIQYENPRDLIV